MLEGMRLRSNIHPNIVECKKGVIELDPYNGSYPDYVVTLHHRLLHPEIPYRRKESWDLPKMLP